MASRIHEMIELPLESIREGIKKHSQIDDFAWFLIYEMTELLLELSWEGVKKHSKIDGFAWSEHSSGSVIH